MNDIKVFIADDVNEDKLAPLREAGFEVVKETKLMPEELAERIEDADGVIVRSATKITADLMDKAKKLRVIGRAGIGVDNIDVKAATERGIVVMNAPDGNTIATAEHTIAAARFDGAKRAAGTCTFAERELGKEKVCRRRT